MWALYFRIMFFWVVLIRGHAAYIALHPRGYSSGSSSTSVSGLVLLRAHHQETRQGPARPPSQSVPQEPKLPTTVDENKTGGDVAQRPSSSSRRRRRNIRFRAPLLVYGYRPAVDEHSNGTLSSKPLLLYLPGLDGTFLCPFLQYPELHTLFDVWCLTVATDDRSTLDELCEDVRTFLLQHSTGTYTRSTCSSNTTNASSTATTTTDQPNQSRPVYLAGESFGGILACEVAAALQQQQQLYCLNQKDDGERINLQGLTLINPATSFDRSILAVQGPNIAKLHPWLYPFGLLTLLPLFTDKYSMAQLFLLLQSRALPSVIDNAAREAYMGRVALSLPWIIPYMTQETLQWRLTAWLATGCARWANGHNNNDSAFLLRQLQHVPSLIVVGEQDDTLPSVEEAARLAEAWPHAVVHVVPDAGHASTCGSRVDLAALWRNRFPALQQQQQQHQEENNNNNNNEVGRTAMKAAARTGNGAYFGMEPRYDNATIGLSPLKYWSSNYYRKYEPGN